MPTAPPITVNTAATRRRVARLAKYVEETLLDRDTFISESCRACCRSRRVGDEFYAGTMGHVGARYDLSMGDKPLRIVVVGQEAKDRQVSLARRRGQVLESAEIDPTILIGNSRTQV